MSEAEYYPVVVLHHGGRWRLFEEGSGKLVETRRGTPRDGGGSEQKWKMILSAKRINASRERRAANRAYQH